MNHNGYLRVRLRVSGRVHWRRLHVLVLEAFVGPRPTPQHHAAHAPDRNKRNCRLDNLAWKLPFENEADKKAHGTARNGRMTTPTQAAVVARIRARAAAGESLMAIARDVGLHRSSVSRIVRGLRHKE